MGDYQLCQSHTKTFVERMNKTLIGETHVGHKRPGHTTKDPLRPTTSPKSVSVRVDPSDEGAPLDE